MNTHKPQVVVNYDSLDRVADSIYYSTNIRPVIQEAKPVVIDALYNPYPKGSIEYINTEIEFYERIKYRQQRQKYLEELKNN